MWYVSFFLLMADACFGNHYLLEAIEERGTREVVDRNLAIEVLKEEVETLEAEKTHLVGKVGGLRIVRADLEEF